MVQCLALVLLNQQLSDGSLSQKTGYSDWGVSWVSSVCPGKCCRILKYAMSNFFHPSQLITHDHWCYITAAADKTMNGSRTLVHTESAAALVQSFVMVISKHKPGECLAVGRTTVFSVLCGPERHLWHNASFSFIECFQLSQISLCQPSHHSSETIHL